MAPEIWQSLMKSPSPRDFFDDMNEADKLEVSKWKAKRDLLLPDRVQKEIDAALECDTSLIRKSVPLIRADVASFDHKSQNVTSVNGAHLTIWEPSDEQASILKEGATVEVYNLCVRDTTFEGKIQLTANSRTRIETFSEDLPTKLTKRHQQGRVQNLFRVHALSHKMIPKSNLALDSGDNYVDTVVNILSFEERVECNKTSFVIFVTDETNLVMRIHCDALPPSLNFFDRENQPPNRIAQFCRLRVMPFDSIENCAVVGWCKESTCSVFASGGAGHDRMTELHQWSLSINGTAQVCRTQRYVDARIPIREQYGYRTAIGYVVALKSAKRLHLEVDCAHNGSIQEWELPVTVLDDMLAILRTIGDKHLNDCVALNLEEDERVKDLLILGSIIRSRGLLWRFTLKRNVHPLEVSSNLEFAVDDASLADTQALGYAYEATI